MPATQTILSIDVGSIAVSMVELDDRKNIVNADYRLHNGDSAHTIVEMLSNKDLSRIAHVATTASTPSHIQRNMEFDSRIAYIAAAKHLNREVGSLLIIGGERFGLVLFDEQGNYLNYRSNSSCAAGTGSFLDQQAKRLNLSGIDHFCRVAATNCGDIPKIASRCSVFAKTDLIHAQQEGYTLEEICDGLCAGLAKNVVDTVFTGTSFQAPVIMAGGVALNQPVVSHISQMIGQTIQVDHQAHLYGALGTALLGIDEKKGSVPVRITKPTDIVQPVRSNCEYHFGPLDLSFSQYPAFTSCQRYERKAGYVPDATPVETDIYENWRSQNYSVYLGFDIGSTSTKAVVVDDQRTVLAGFYTRTAGRPIEAVQAILETLDDACERDDVRFTIQGVGTTGSGRKFIGTIIGADLVLDEISAHARAAYELDPRVDTIIEIGGQDAKFTTLQNGSVTFSVMNTVCAAGTGSFIEEQAKKLGCPLSEYSARAEGISAPLASDRCTVFMERDLNYFLNAGYAVEEILAAVLHAVRENYLTKVAIEKNIGEYVFFQGATAKNRALVAAFEQRLGKPIMVSKYCHLTGALGVALELCDQTPALSRFKGIALYKRSIPVTHEVCELCTNHCKIRVAEVEGQKEAYGFLCGRDYQTQAHGVQVPSPYHFLRERRKAFQLTATRLEVDPQPLTIGIPAALHLVDELPLWRSFFNQLGVKTVISEHYGEAIKAGKHLTGAEFCAPITALHGHVSYLADRCDYIFLPFYLEHKQKAHTDKSIRRQYCYYTQFAPAITALATEGQTKTRLLSPVLRSIQGHLYMKAQLYRSLRHLPGLDRNFFQISQAYDRAQQLLMQGRDQLRQRFLELTETIDDVQVVLLGRPYTVLSPYMNNGIPDILAKLNVRVFYQDMIPYTEQEIQAIAPLQKVFHWHYAAQILAVAETIGQRRGLYPVLMTSFKCAPDSFVIDYFKKIMELHQKPYLILQLDEHDSSVGYETRIEAGLRAFRNHFNNHRLMPVPPVASNDTSVNSPLNPQVTTDGTVLRHKTLLIPRWDDLSGRLVVATLRAEGIDARLVDETAGSIHRSMRHNSGQCIPLNICIQNVVEYIDAHQLDPNQTAVWIFNGTVACNIHLYPYFIKSQLEALGNGLEMVDVYVGEITFADMSYQTIVNVYFAYMFGGMLRRVACSMRPYELVAGQTDQVLGQAIDILEEETLHKRSKGEALQKALALFDTIAVKKTKRPKVALFGDLYVRDNDVMNQDLIRTIEQNGGEVITTPYNEYLKIVAEAYIKKWIKEGYYGFAATATITRTVVGLMERKYIHYFKRFLSEPEQRGGRSADAFMAQLAVNPNNTGESMDNLLKIYAIVNAHPDISLFVQTNPAFCCPSLITEAMADKIEALTGVPILTIEYDGTSTSKNEDVIPYLAFPRTSCNTDKRMIKTL